MRRDLVFLEEEIDAFGIAVDGLLLECHHLLQIEIRSATADSHLGEAVPDLRESFRCMEQRLRGDAADVETCASMARPFVDDANLHAELRCPDRAHIAARAGTDYQNVILGHGALCLLPA